MAWDFNNQFMPYPQQPMQQNRYYNQNLPHYQITKVRGENGARSMQMAPNSDVLVLDETQPIIWLVQTDGAGYLTVTPFDYQQHKEQPPVDVNSLEQRIARLEGILNGKSNAESSSETESTK